MNKELASALLKAQGAMGKLLKDSNNPHFNTTYASLAAVLDTVRGPLTDAGLVLYQSATTDDGSVLVHSALIHAETGEMVEEVLSLPVAQRTPQALGSAITYGRRYLAMAMCGLAPDDDDGEEDSKEAKAKAQPRLEKNKQPAQPPAAQHRPPPPQPKAQPQSPTADRLSNYPSEEADVDFGQGSGWDDIPDAAEMERRLLEVAPTLLHIDMEIPENAVKLMGSIREKHKASGDKFLSVFNKQGQGSGQYGLLVGKIDHICGSKKAHGPVLAALCGVEVSQENPPGWKVKELIDWLQEDSQYRTLTADAVKAVWEAINKAVEAVNA